ncbi:TetR/AcrR family transcriptional regulator [Streptomyces chartreusis]|uniref:TetR/AcrR family transcriptional regulator n=1 Tax=Streptomyces chartreusis TaxID=1969 RepID=UPI00362CAC4D
MRDVAGRARLDDAPERLVRAAIGLLAEQGPSDIKARAVATASGLSTMVVYSHFGGIPELMRAVADHGFTELGKAFAQVPAPRPRTRPERASTTRSFKAVECAGGRATCARRWGT